MEENFKCPRCGNEDERYIGVRDGKKYCRACISFNGKNADKAYIVNKGIKLHLSYPLSLKQQMISDQVSKAIKDNRDVLICAVTGAGKTELVYKSIEEALIRGKHVGFTVPRRDVVIDLVPRFKESFPKADIVSVYGDHTSRLNGDIILLTTHQLYRYESYFDLLILDELDAFPFKGNKTLKTFFNKAVRGNKILLTATSTREDRDEIKKRGGLVLTLDERYHKKRLPVPTFIKCSNVMKHLLVLRLLKGFVKERKPVFVFTPTIEKGRILYNYLSLFISNGAFVSSKEEDRKENIERFKQGQLDYLVTTSILERGVTLFDLQVIVFDADDDIFNSQALIQIAGRVGRKIHAEDGKVIFIGQEENKEIEDAIYRIEESNRKAEIL